MNRERRRAGVPALAVDGRLATLARGRASAMAGRRRLSHGGWERALRAAVPDAGALGENVAGGQPSASAVVSAWLASRGHRRNLLDPAFQLTGVGCVVDTRGRRWWVQVFAGRLRSRAR